MEQLDLFSGGEDVMPTPEDSKVASLTHPGSVSEAKKSNASLTPDYSINFYRSGPSSRCFAQYARVSYREGNRTKHVHIPGGNVTSRLMQKRLKLLNQSKELGAPLGAILQLIGTWKS